MAQQKAKITKRGKFEFEILRVHTEIMDRTGMVHRKRHAEAELASVRQDMGRLKTTEQALLDEIAQIDAALADEADEP